MEKENKMENMEKKFSDLATRARGMKVDRHLHRTIFTTAAELLRELRKNEDSAAHHQAVALALTEIEEDLNVRGEILMDPLDSQPSSAAAA